jgi:SAM-dependent methyltransferase
VLSHQAIPFVSYPYEWTFSMAKAAALLQLDLLSQALDEGLVLRDGTAFNVQWVGSQPTFIDVTSFGRWQRGDAWAGYRQFCSQCLNPLLLYAYKGVPFGPWLRGELEGIEPGVLASLCSLRDLLRRGIFTHVYLHARLQSRYQGTDQAVRTSVRAAGLGTDVIRSTVRSLRRVIEPLHLSTRRSPWIDYTVEHGYDAIDHARKRAFVERVVKARRRRLVWDLGCNTGEYARLASDHSAYVVALDADHASVEAVYHQLAREGRSDVLPLVANVANPSPNQGWRQGERLSLLARGRPDLVLCLALAHHLVIGANVPVAELIDFMAELADELVIEFVDRQDPMVQRLLRNREDTFRDYTREDFERQLGRAFRVECTDELANGLRVLYYARRDRAA